MTFYSLQMIGLYRDPTGIKIFDNRHSSPNYDENDVVALRRDVQQLRVSLHFAQVCPLDKECSTSCPECEHGYVPILQSYRDFGSRTLTVTIQKAFLMK